MAATDKPFHNPRVLDITFAVSNILMLLAVVWMFWQDYAREYKDEQRYFREVEVAMAQRAAFHQIPDEAEFANAEKAVVKAKADRDAKAKDIAEARAILATLQPQKERAESRFQANAAEIPSTTSFINSAREHREPDHVIKELVDKLEKQTTERDDAQAKRDEIVTKMKVEQAKIDAIESPYTKAVADFKKVNDKLDTQVKLALAKRWTIWDRLRMMPVLDGFAAPVKIHQFTINDIPIDYNFKYVTRFDRCMTCHTGIDRPNYTRSALEALTKDDPNAGKMADAKARYDRRVKALEGTSDAAGIPNPHDIALLNLSPNELTPARITQFAAHPRLDLFVGANSKHPSEKFGCTSCHYGQGSGTSFLDSSHNPNTAETRKKWEENRHWEHNHMWDFPMLPSRFTEASCIKCHHEVTDLYSRDNRAEAPKVLRGYNLIKENGCFGCHEISGYKSGNRIGPDIRLEPSTPLEDLHPLERDRAEKDTDNRVGHMRKVGPSLARMSEKLTQEWVEKWVRSPSSFRPDTKMPHYYGLSTNDKGVLPADQKEFPNAEIAAIAHFLMANSKTYLADAEKIRKDGGAQKDQDRLVELLNKGRLENDEKDEFAQLKWRIKVRKEGELKDLAPGYKGDAKKGRVLFTERGCLACHTHHGTETVQNDVGLFAADLKSDATFGPSLSQLPEKLGKSDGARKWLIQWIMNPQFHSPRSRMPVTHLSGNEAADIAAWLLGQNAMDLGDDWGKDNVMVTAPIKKDLEDLARVYLTRMLSKADMEKFLDGKAKADDPSVKLMLKDVNEDERKLYAEGSGNEDALKFYLGKKAVSRLGCYACHDIPGFESIKPIGVGLNDWGKKPVDRLAFEDIDNFYRQHYYAVDSLADKDGKPVGMKDGKEPYETFFGQALLGKSNLDDPRHGHLRQREGYLNQKIRDPRSYDFNRDRAWDDRARMPKFTFARPRKQKDEEAEKFKARVMKDEAEARESVATFVLGLVAEMVPSASTNQPKGDRLAEVKGRQVIDKYNCASCHLIRPGLFDINLGPETLKQLEKLHKFQSDEKKTSDEYVYPNDTRWVGRNALGTTVRAFGSHANILPSDDPGERAENYVRIALHEALRFEGSDKSIKIVPAGSEIRVYFKDVHADPASINSVGDFERAFPDARPFGGSFADLMTQALIKKDKNKYKPRAGDSDDARAVLPPSLVGQGERTQADWLYRFLLDPQPIRPMTILRMPKFNMSKEEAKALVDYFAAVSRQNNIGVGLYPHESVPARDDLNSAYWLNKNAAYIEYLKKTKDVGKDGKELPTSLFDARIKSYTPLWEEIRAAREPELKATDEKLKKSIKAQGAEVKEKETDLGKEQDAAKKEKLKKAIEDLQLSIKAAESESAEIGKALTQLDVKVQQENWEKRDAYAADGYRMLTGRQLCTQCHQVGSVASSQTPDKSGPPLALANERLRADWMERWISKPHRFLPYGSPMTQYFKKGVFEHQQNFAGPSIDQIQAARDALVNFPRVSALPINSAYSPDRPAGGNK
jgi:cytochrome c2